MIELAPVIKEALNKIEFLGYPPLFDAKEKFYKIQEEKIGIYTFGFHILLQGGEWLI